MVRILIKLNTIFCFLLVILELAPGEKFSSRPRRFSTIGDAGARSARDVRMSVVAIFVGGRSKRMGQPKGRLIVPGAEQTIIEHLVEQTRAAKMTPLFVGDDTEYRDLVSDVPRVSDVPQGVGPIGGLHAALRFASSRKMITVACDMPYVDAGVLAQVRDYQSEADALVVAFRRKPDAPWESMLARFDSERARPLVQAQLKAGIRSFQRLFAALGAEARPHDEAILRALIDWDTPNDLP